MDEELNTMKVLTLHTMKYVMSPWWKGVLMTGARPTVGQIHVTVTDVERSVAFYRDVLGLEHLFTVPGQPMAFLDGGGVRLYLGVTEDESFQSRPLIYYRVADLDEAWRGVTARGAPEVSAPTLVHRDGDTELWMAFVRDPDGIPVGLMSERPGR
jgi:predicted enzyme related to lactoylglutathione lyase